MGCSKEAGTLESFEKELRFAAIGTLVLDVLLWLLSLPFMKAFSLMWHEVPAGLLLGSAGMFLNLLLIRRTVQNAVYHGKTRDFGGYLLRCLVASSIIALAMTMPWMNALAAILPFLYPKILFGIIAMRGNKFIK